MFDIGFSELVLIALLALIVLGPKRLPEVARAAGRGLGWLRRFMTDVKQDFDRELRTAELSELQKLKQELHDTRRLIEESSDQLYHSIAQPPPGAGATPPAGIPTNNPEPATPAPSRKRVRRARATKDGGTPKA